MSLFTTVYEDDPDAYVDRLVTDAQGNDLTFTPLVAANAGAYDMTATWQGVVGPSRVLRVPVTALPVGIHRLYLAIPGSNDLDLGTVYVVARK